MGRVQLYCPSKKKTVEGFVIGAYRNLEQVLQGVRLALDIKYAALYTVEAKPINEPSTLQEDQHVLVAATENETMLPDAPSEWLLYDGEEGDDIDPDTDGYGLEWDNLSDHEKCLHITSLNEQKPATRNKLRITRPYKSVQADLLTIDSTSIPPDNRVAEDPTNIEQRWGVTIEQFLPTSMKPPAANFSQKTTDVSILAVLSILSSFTHGQARLALEVLEEAVALRTQEDQGDDKDPILQKQDVLNAIEIVYERADVIPAKLTKAKSGRSGRRRRGRRSSVA